MKLQEIEFLDVMEAIAFLLAEYDYKTRPAIIMNSRLANYILKNFKAIKTSIVLEQEFKGEDGESYPFISIIGGDQVVFDGKSAAEIAEDETWLPDDIAPSTIFNLNIEYNDLIEDDFIGITPDKNKYRFPGTDFEKPFGVELPYVRGDENFNIGEFNQYAHPEGKYYYKGNCYYRIGTKELVHVQN